MPSLNPISNMSPEEATRQVELISKAEKGTLIEVNEGKVTILGGFGKFIRWVQSLFIGKSAYDHCNMDKIAGSIVKLFEQSQQGNTKELLPELEGKLRSLNLQKGEMRSARDNLIAEITKINNIHHHPEIFIQEYLSRELGLEGVKVEAGPPTPLSLSFRITSKHWEGEAHAEIMCSPLSSLTLQDGAQSAVFQALYNAQVGCPMPAGFNGTRTIEKDSFSEPTISVINKWLATLKRDPESPAPELKIEGDSYTITHTGIKGQIPFQFRAGSKDTSQILPGPTFFQLQLSICREKLFFEQTSARISKALQDIGLAEVFVKNIEGEEPSTMFFEITLPGEHPLSFPLWLKRDEATGQTIASDDEIREAVKKGICDHLNSKIDEALNDFGLAGIPINAIQEEGSNTMSFEITLPGEHPPVILSIRYDETIQLLSRDAEISEMVQRRVSDSLYGTEQYIQLLSPEKSEIPYYTSYTACAIQYYQQALRDDMVQRINEWLTELRNEGKAVPGSEFKLSEDGESYSITGSEIKGDIMFYYPLTEGGEADKREFYPHFTVTELFKDICRQLIAHEWREAPPP